MSRIKSIHIHNFKFFDEQPPIKLGEKGKHLLLFGENGSGKSSVYQVSPICNSHKTKRNA